jgi:hypothetical protein
MTPSKHDESHMSGSLPDCAECCAYVQGLSDAVDAIEQLLNKPIILIGGMKPTQEKQTRDDIRYGMQKALLCVVDLRGYQGKGKANDR